MPHLLHVLFYAVAALVSVEIVSLALLICTSFYLSRINKGSTNAEAVCLIRVVSSLLKGAMRFHERERYFGFAFLSLPMRCWYRWIYCNSLLWSVRLMQTAFFAFDNFRAGMVSFLSIRGHLGDAFFLRMIREANVSQLVILGAGYDTRAYRYAEERRRKGVVVFEVDLPEVQTRKLSILTTLAEGKGKGDDHRSSPLSNVVFVPCDFGKEDVGSKLLSSGFNPSRESAVLWEGVTIYLEEEAVSATLSSLMSMMSQQPTCPENVMPPSESVSASTTPDCTPRASCRAPNKNVSLVVRESESSSRAVGFESQTPTPERSPRQAGLGGATLHLQFDYLNQRYLSGERTDAAVVRMIAGMERYGTPFKFGVVPEEIGTYVGRWGFEVVSRWGPSRMTRNFLPGWFTGLTDTDWAHVVECRLVTK